MLRLNDGVYEFSKAISDAEFKCVCGTDPDTCKASDVIAAPGTVLVCEVVGFLDPRHLFAVAFVWSSWEGSTEHGWEAYATGVVPT